MMAKTLRIVALSLICAATSHGALIIAAQDFNGLSDGGTFTNQSWPDGTTSLPLFNAGAINIGGGGMDFLTLWTDTTVGDSEGGPVASNENSDFIGVNSFAGANSPDVAPGGALVASGVEHNFEFNDGDGLLALVFSPVDVSGFPNVEVSLNYWIRDTSWEMGDSFAIDVTDGVSTVNLLSFDETGLAANSSADDGTDNWKSFSADISALGLGPNISLIVSTDNDSGTENMFIDNVVIESIPEPGSLLLMVFGVALLSLKRKK